MIAILFISLLFVCEAWLEVIVISLKNYSDPNYQKKNKQEHDRSAVFASIIIAYVGYDCWESENEWLIPAVIVSRRIFFDYGLIIFRDRPRNKYEGDDRTARVLSAIFGNNGRKKELAITLVIYFAAIIKSLYL